MIETVWFWLATLMITAYVVLDGFDLGAGILHLTLARTENDRKTILRAIGPYWDANEVWLIASGGVLFSAFPALFASSFSGFYLPLTIILWLLMLRGLAIEFRSHMRSPVWTPLWDAVFSVASLLLTIFFGAALGNVVRGVPLDSNGEFFLPLWTGFTVSANPGVLDWFTILVAACAAVAVARHGALWIAFKTLGHLHDTALAVAGRLWWPLLTLTLAVSIATFAVQPHVLRRISTHPAGALIPLAALAALLASKAAARKSPLRAVLASSAYLAAMLASAAFGLYPYLLPSSQAGNGLTVDSAAAGAYTMSNAFWWWLPGIVLAVSYFVHTHRVFAGKIDSSQ
jgi:cytochrome d ubiquinol oxidase subunit II